VKRFSFLLNAALAMAILYLISLILLLPFYKISKEQSGKFNEYSIKTLSGYQKKAHVSQIHFPEVSVPGFTNRILFSVILHDRERLPLTSRQMCITTTRKQRGCETVNVTYPVLVLRPSCVPKKLGVNQK
jgi:hypothetical protein